MFAAVSDQCGMFSFLSLYDAYLAWQKRKRNTANAFKFENGLTTSRHGNWHRYHIISPCFRASVISLGLVTVC